MSAMRLFAVLASTLLASGALQAQVVISEFRTRGPAGGNDEFVELFNTSASPVDISGWRMKGSNAMASVSTRATVPMGMSIPGYGHYLFTNSAAGGYSGLVVGDQTYGTGIGDNGGIALTLADDVSFVDQVGLSAGSAYGEGNRLPGLTNNVDTGYERKPGGAGGSFQDTNDNVADFAQLTPTAPQNLASPPTGPAGVPNLSIDDVVISEDGGNAVFTVTLAATNPPPRAPNGGTIASVNFTTVAGTAETPDDFTTMAGTLNFAAAGSQTISVPIADDLLDEAAVENFSVQLSAANGATISDDSGLCTINDNDAAPTLIVGDTSWSEGNTGTSNAPVYVALSAPSGQTVTVTATTADGSATLADNDYVATTVQLTFLPGEQYLSFDVPIVGDLTVEPDETVLVNLSAETNATILDGQGEITITNTDTSAELSTTISVSPDPVAAGGTITYVVTLTNAGPDTSFGIHMDMPLPAGTTFLSQSNDASWICFTPLVGAGGGVLCGPPFSNHPVGSVEFTIVVSVDPAVAGGTILTATATATATTPDPTPSNNASAGSTTVLGPVLAPVAPIPALDRFGQLLVALLVLGFAALSLRRHAG